MTKDTKHTRCFIIITICSCCARSVAGYAILQPKTPLSISEGNTRTLISNAS